jgi:hypothetical protein
MFPDTERLRRETSSGREIRVGQRKVKQIDELLDGYEKENAEELVADIRKISDEIIEEL